jgi:RHS repeat-associated protein
MITNEETITTYVIGHQRISQIVVKNGTEQEYYFTFDGHGSTRVLVNFVGAIVQLYSFDAYGNDLGFDVSQALTEFLYSGEQFDSKIGQQYLRQRYYDQVTGRFNRLDPFFGNLNDPLSLNKYSYVHNDPVTYIDPTGCKIYFVIRPINFGAPYINNLLLMIQTTFKVGIHGYLYLSNTKFNGNYGSEQYITNEQGFNNGTTFSWHPYRWLTIFENTFQADNKYPVRVWVNDPRDKEPTQDELFMREAAIFISSDLELEKKLAQYINSWIHNFKVGWDAYMEIGDSGISGNYWHVDPQIGAEKYSFLDQNCFWWTQKMLSDTNILNPYNLFRRANWSIMMNNFGVGTTWMPVYSLYHYGRMPDRSVGSFIGSIYARILSLVTYHETEVQYHNWDGVIEPPF